MVHVENDKIIQGARTGSTQSNVIAALIPDYSPEGVKSNLYAVVAVEVGSGKFVRCGVSHAQALNALEDALQAEAAGRELIPFGSFWLFVRRDNSIELRAAPGVASCEEMSLMEAKKLLIDLGVTRAIAINDR